MGSIQPLLISVVAYSSKREWNTCVEHTRKPLSALLLPILSQFAHEDVICMICLWTFRNFSFRAQAMMYNSSSSWCFLFFLLATVFVSAQVSITQPSSPECDNVLGNGTTCPDCVSRCGSAVLLCAATCARRPGQCKVSADLQMGKHISSQLTKASDLHRKVLFLGRLQDVHPRMFPYSARR